MLFAVMLMVSVATSAVAGGDVYFGKYIDSKYNARPGGLLMKKATFISGVYLDNEFDFKKAYLPGVKPWLRLETLMDGYNGNGSFHPASIKYDVGVTFDVYKGTYVDVSRMCWHPIDSDGRVEQYWLIKGGYKW